MEVTSSEGYSNKDDYHKGKMMEWTTVKDRLPDVKDIYLVLFNAQSLLSRERSSNEVD
jgi:hypothetical protein